MKNFHKSLDDEFVKITREARYIASLNHVNIIRYYNSWIEISKMKNKNSHKGVKKESDSSDIEGEEVEKNKSKNEFDLVIEEDDCDLIEFVDESSDS